MEEGSYYVYLAEAGHRVEFYSFKTGDVTEITNIVAQYIEGICVSPDRYWLLYSKQEQIESDIILMKNFR